VANILNSATTSNNFITSMVNEAVLKGYSGYNLDWEMNGIHGFVDGSYAGKFVAFVNAFKAALSPHGLSLSVDVVANDIAGSWCSDNNGFLDFSQLRISAIDRVIIEDYTPELGQQFASCQQVPLSVQSPVVCPYDSTTYNAYFTGLLNYMCSNLPKSMVVIGMLAGDPTQNSFSNSPIAGQCIAALESYGITKVALWPQPNNNGAFIDNTGLVAPQNTWYAVLLSFLGAVGAG